MKDHATTAEQWETGALGQSEEHAQVAPRELSKQVDEALGMQAISIRLPKELIDEFKMIAAIHNVGYQPLMRDALKRFAHHELKLLVLQYQQKQELERAKAVEDVEREAREARKAA